MQDDIAERLARIESKIDEQAAQLDALIEALAFEQDEETGPASTTLDGHLAGGERDQNQPL